jgi:hypothetical protein
MMRIAIGLIGFIYGLIFVWSAQFILNKIDWQRSNIVVQGCYELGKCPISWWKLLGLFAYIFTPPLLFAMLNIIAWKRWKLSRWGIFFCLLTIVAITIYILSYI